MTARNCLVEVRTKLNNTVRSYLRTQAMPAVRATPKTFANNVRLELASRDTGLPDYIESLLVSIEEMNSKIQDADEALKQVADSDPICKLLQRCWTDYVGEFCCDLGRCRSLRKR